MWIDLPTHAANWDFAVGWEGDKAVGGYRIAAGGGRLHVGEDDVDHVGGNGRLRQKDVAVKSDSLLPHRLWVGHPVIGHIRHPNLSVAFSGDAAGRFKMVYMGMGDDHPCQIGDFEAVRRQTRLAAAPNRL